MIIGIEIDDTLFATLTTDASDVESAIRDRADSIAGAWSVVAFFSGSENGYQSGVLYNDKKENETMKRTKLFYEVFTYVCEHDQTDGFDTIDLVEDTLRLRRVALKLKRLDELACNGYPKLVVEYREGKRYEYHVEDEALRAEYERREAQLERRLAELGDKWNAPVHHQSDPRGWTIKGFEPFGLRLGQFVNRSVGG